MAAKALSTLAPVPSRRIVGPVTRAIAAMRQPEPHPQEGRGCIIIDGALVTFDAGRTPPPEGLAVVITMDREVIVAPIPEQEPRPYPLLGKGLVFIRRTGPLPYGVREIRDPVALLGAVV